MPRIVKEPAERKLVEPVIVPVLVVVEVVVVVVAQLLGVDGVKVGRVRVKEDAGLVRRLLAPQPRAEVHAVEEGVLLDLLGAVHADPLVGGGAEGEDEVLGLLAEAGAPGDAHELLPVDHLQVNLNSDLVKNLSVGFSFLRSHIFYEITTKKKN